MRRRRGSRSPRGKPGVSVDSGVSGNRPNGGVGGVTGCALFVAPPKNKIPPAASLFYVGLYWILNNIYCYHCYFNADVLKLIYAVTIVLLYGKHI